MKNYVAGFLFDEGRVNVALIQKQRPAWQKGKYNGIGGHIEEGETPEAAMQREFQEETGLKIYDWQKFCVLQGEDFCVHFFRAFNDCVVDAGCMTDEEVVVFRADRIPQAEIIPNLRWLIPMARLIEKDNVRHYHIQENG